MDPQSQTILQALVKIAWADGRVSDDERRLLTRVLHELGTAPAEIAEFERLLGCPPDENAAPAPLPIEELEEDKRCGVMRALLIMSFMDGHLCFAEIRELERYQLLLGISPERMETLRAEAVAAAETLSASELSDDD